MATQGKTILCAWEIGGALGHISRFSAMVKALESEGHHVVLALKDLARAFPFFCDTRARLLQAPVWLPKVTMQRPVACLADTLLCLGYLEDEPLDCLVQAWEGIIRMVKPDLIIFDYAPTAMLAAYHLASPKILIGTGFADPLPGKPIADWRPHPKNDALIERQSQRVLQQINRVFARRQQPPLGQLSDLFAVDRSLISTFPELDLYRQRGPNTIYCTGPSEKLVEKQVTFSGDKRRILAYLKPDYPQLTTLLDALAACNAQVFIACPQANPDIFARYTRDGFHFSTQLVDLQSAVTQADLFVGHGNASSVKESLAAGVPMVIMPLQLEQLLTGQRIQQRGYGVLLEKMPTQDALVTKLEDLLKDPASYRTAIADLLAQHPQPRPCVARAIVQLVAELLAPAN